MMDCYLSSVCTPRKYQVIRNVKSTDGALRVYFDVVDAGWRILAEVYYLDVAFRVADVGQFQFPVDLHAVRSLS